MLPWSALVGNPAIKAVDLTGLRLTLRRDKDGRANWTAAGRPRSGGLPRVEQLAVHDGVVDFADLQRDVAFHAKLATTSPGPSETRLTVTAKGLSQGQAWTADGAADASHRRTGLYGLDLRLALDGPGGRSTARFVGTVSTKGARRLTGALVSAGPDLHNLAHLLDVPLLRTPPYSLQANLAADAKRVDLTGMSGRVGRSDLEGDLAIIPKTHGPRSEFDLEIELAADVGPARGGERRSTDAAPPPRRTTAARRPDQRRAAAQADRRNPL